MTKEQKNLLLKDLCARLPYGVKIAMPGLWDNKITIEPLTEIFKGDDDLFRVNGNGHCIEYIKPYLFPMSSMTEEQKKELRNLGWYFDNFEINNIDEFNTNNEYIEHSDCYILIDWLNKNYFDYRGLIPMELAIDATGLNIY